MNRGMMSLALCALLLPSLVLANGGRPDLPERKKEKVVRFSANVPITITYSKDIGKTEDPRLVIPKKFMVAAADGELVPRADGSSNRILVTGLALSAALVTGGLWFVRRSGKAGRTILALFIVSSLVSFAAFLPQVAGDAGPMPRMQKVEIDGNKVKIGVDVVIMENGDRIELVLPAALAPAAAPAKR